MADVVDRPGNVEPQAFGAADDVGDVVAAGVAGQHIPDSAAGLLQAIKFAAELVDRAAEDIAEVIELPEDVAEIAVQNVPERVTDAAPECPPSALT